MDKNTITGIVLIIAVFIAFSLFNKPSKQQLEQQKHTQDSIAALQVQSKATQPAADSIQMKDGQTISSGTSDSLKNEELKNKFGVFSAASQGEEKLITIENKLVEIKLSSKGGRVYSARLKNHVTHDSLPLLLFDKDEASFGLSLITANNRIVNTSDLFFESQQTDSGKVIMTLHAGENSYLKFIYALAPNDYMLRFEIESSNLEQQLSAGTNSLDLQWKQQLRKQEMGRKYEERYAYLMYKYVADDVEHMKESKDDSKDIPNKVKWVAYKDQFFASVLIADEDFEASKMDSKYYTDGEYLKQYSMTSSIAFNPKGTQKKGFYFFFGPNQYSLLKNYDKTYFKGQDLELEKLVPLGWSLFRYVNKWLTIPIFDFWVRMIGNIGLAIFLLTLTIKTLLFPLTYKSFMSSAKMRVMRPQVEVINEKFPGQENAMTRQQKTMELYRQAGVNPLSGCLPMLLQMPFLFALFMFFPSAIELRHASFLWAKDLASYDAIISWNANIPLISSILGNHISLFCLLMTITSLVYTKFNMDQSNTGQQQMPGMQTMMYIMPVMMFFFLNSYPSGLNYYYFISTLITVLQTLIFRYFVNEKKLLAKLEENKKKPAKKKSGFMARLEEAQKQQQTLAKQRAQQQHKSKR